MLPCPELAVDKVYCFCSVSVYLHFALFTRFNDIVTFRCYRRILYTVVVLVTALKRKSAAFTKNITDHFSSRRYLCLQLVVIAMDYESIITLK